MTIHDELVLECPIDIAEEVAQILGSSEATVRSQISKARVKMKGFVERYFGRRS